MPTSVLLAVLAAAGLLALAPALVRRYDATERLAAERAQSTARVVTCVGARCRARRTFPGRQPVNPPRLVAARANAAPTPVAGEPSDDASARSSSTASASVTAAATSGSTPGARPGVRPATAGVRGEPSPRPVSAPPATPHARPRPDARRMAAARRRTAGLSRAVYRRRRVLLALVLFNVVELTGVVVVGPGFWIGASVAGSLLLLYLVHLRNRALLDRRRRRVEAKYAAWLAARQAAVRREQARRAAARRVALEQQLAERDRVRREAARLASLRGRPYSSRAVGL